MMGWLIAAGLVAYGAFCFTQGAQWQEGRYAHATEVVNRWVQKVNQRETAAYLKSHKDRVAAHAKLEKALGAECKITAAEAEAFKRIK